MTWFATWRALRRQLHDHALRIRDLEARLEIANDRAAVMDRCMGEDSRTIERQQLILGKQRETIDGLLEQLRQQKRGEGDGEAND